jgi:FAD/FMN-containing dehydrogenase
MANHTPTTLAFTHEEVAALRNGLRGELLLPDDPGYDEARAIWNGMIDRRPGLIIRCLGANDVAAGVDYAREQGLPLAVKGGGHNVAGNAVCDDGVMLDLSLMRSVQVNPDKRTVRVDGGCLLSDVDMETQRHGLAVSGGIVSHTGVAGLTLGGGFGWISRKYGLSVDNLLSAEVVTADGRILTASEEQNPDLFWGLRGGGGNFGVVTSFEFQAGPLGPDVFSGIVAQRFEDAKAYMQFHTEYVRTLPDEMTVWMVIRHAPPLPFLDEDVHGKLMVLVPHVYTGDPAEGERLIQPIRDFGRPHGEFIGTHPWTVWQAAFDGLVTHGARNYWKSHHLKAFPPEVIDTVLDFAARMPSPQCEIFIPHMEGAPARVPDEATAYAHRKAPFILNIHARWTHPGDDEKHIAWARDLHKATERYAEGVYVNFLSDEGQNRVRDAYPPQTWERLVALKRRYDPDNLFHMNQNIRP